MGSYFHQRLLATLKVHEFLVDNEMFFSVSLLVLHAKLPFLSVFDICFSFHVNLGIQSGATTDVKISFLFFLRSWQGFVNINQLKEETDYNWSETETLGRKLPNQITISAISLALRASSFFFFLRKCELVVEPWSFHFYRHEKIGRARKMRLKLGHLE